MPTAIDMTTQQVADTLVKLCSKGKFDEASEALYSPDIVSIEGPLVAGSHFAVKFKLDITFKPEAKRFTMEEIAVYKVANGKVVHEEFFYSM